MNEATLKGALVKAMRTTMPGAVVFRHEDRFTGGIPDISVTWAGIATWWEVKYSPIGCNSTVTKLQGYTLEQLSRQSTAGLITYTETKRAGRTVAFLEYPDDVGATMLTGWRHEAVASLIQGYHVLPPTKELP